MRFLLPQHRGFYGLGTQPKTLNHLPATTIPRRAYPLLPPTTSCFCPSPRTHGYSLSCNAHAPQPSTPPSSQSISSTQGLARSILAQPGIEGDPLAFLEVSEAYWRALRNQKHEPHKKGPSVVTYADGPLPTLPATSIEGVAASAAATATGSTNGLPQEGNGAVAVSAPPLPSPTQHQQQASGLRHSHDFDVVICGGTLGLFLATALQLRGWRVAIVERRLVQGRNQEWNISWGELEVLVELGLLSRTELREAVVSEFNPIRVGFLGGKDMWTSDVLNLGVQPRRLLEALRRRFTAAGGAVYENTAFRAATIHSDGILLKLSPGGGSQPLAVGDTNRPNGLGSSSAPPSQAPPRSLTCRLLLDCMGHYSDIVKQIRGRVKPDGMCMVVGSCAEGFPPDCNQSADLLYSLSHACHDLQLFWEAFPAEGGAARTTYMFAYSDAHPDRPSFEQLLDTYFEMLPQYQKVPLEQLRFKRVLFGGFPCYNDGPLPPAFDRVMQIGDASASQSPLSFGGFGSMMRHLGRLTRGLDQALAEDRLLRKELAWLQPYQPSLSASWLFQRSMSFGVGQVSYPTSYPYMPPYCTADITSAPALATDSASFTDTPAAAALVIGAGAGPAAAFQEAVAMAAARFAAGAADPADYFHEEPDQDIAALATASTVATTSPAAKPMAATATSQRQQQQQQQPRTLFERDFRWSPAWLRLPYSHVNEILGCNFGVMDVLGDRVLRPFLQDTIQLVPLSLSMVGMMLANPVTVSRVLLQVGPRTLVGWFAHYAALVTYSIAFQVLRPLRQFVPYYAFQRLLDALEYGSGSDYCYHGPVSPAAVAGMSSAIIPSQGVAAATTAAAAADTAAETAAAMRQPIPTTASAKEDGAMNLDGDGDGNGDGRGEDVQRAKESAAAV